MSQPTPYTVQTSFNQDEVNGAGGRSTVKTASLDTEFDNLKTTLDEILTNLALLQRDDGKIKDGLGEAHLFNLSASASGFLKHSSGSWSFITDPTDPAQTAQAAAEVAQAAAEAARDLAQQHKNNAETAKLAAETAQAAAELAAQSTSSPAAVQSGSFWYGVSSGTGTAYLLTLSPTPSSIAAGLFIHMKAHTANTGLATLNVNSLGAKSIKRNDGSDLKANDIEANVTIILLYDGTNFQLFSSEANSQAAIELNASNIFRAFEEIQENHGGALLMEAGWSDSFSTANEQGADEANSTGFQHDGTNDLYKGTDPGVGLNADQNFTNESDYEFHKESLSDVSVSGDVVTLNSGTLGANVDSARAIIGANEANILSRDSDTQFTVESGHSLSGTNVACEIRFHQFDSGVVKLNEAQDTPTLDLTITGSGGIGSAGPREIGDEIGGQLSAGQSFEPNTTGPIHSWEFDIKKQGNPIDNLFVEIWSTSGGLPNTLLATSDVISASTFTTSHVTTTFNFSGINRVTLTAGTRYAAIAARSGNLDNSNHCWIDGTNSSTYASGADIFERNTEEEWYENNTFEHKSKLYLANFSNVINEYTPVFPKYANLADTAPWSDENSMAQTETLNSATIWYFEIFATSNYGANTVLKITDGAGGNVRPIVQNNGGTWEYNSNTTFGSTTWTSATANSMTQAIIDAMGVAANQMTGTTRSATPDTAPLIDTSKKRGTGVVLYSTVNTNNPEVDQTRINYDTQRGAMDLRSKTYDPGFVASEAYVWARAEHSDSNGPGTFSVTRNDGTEWTTLSMTQQGLPLTGDIRILRGTIDISGQTSGQDLRCRYQTTQNKDQFLHSWGLQVKS